MSRYTVCYDVSHDGRRARVASILLEFGRRVQRSVFEVSLDLDELAELRRRVGPLLARTDLFDIYPIDTRRPEARISWQRSPVPPDIIIVGPFHDPDNDWQDQDLDGELPFDYNTGAAP